MNSKIFCLLFIFTCFAPRVMAHEGHNHDTPKTLNPLKGGTIKTFLVENSDGNKNINCFVEVVKSGKKDLKIYFFDKDQKSVSAKDFELVATVIPFKTKKSELLPVIDKEKFYQASYDKKNAHKYDLVLKFKGPKYCKADEEVTFIID